MRGVSWKDSSLHTKSEVFGFAIHIPTGANTVPVQQVGANGLTVGFNFCRHGVISAAMVLLVYLASVLKAEGMSCVSRLISRGVCWFTVSPCELVSQMLLFADLCN